MSPILKTAAPARKIADCDYGRNHRLVVAIGSHGYVKTPYETGELNHPADPRGSRAPKSRTPFLRINRKGSK